MKGSARRPRSCARLPLATLAAGRHDAFNFRAARTGSVPFTTVDDVTERVRAHYQTYAAEELQRLAKDRYARIEFEVTWHLICQVLPPKAWVLDAGSGPGRYAVALAAEGHRVTLLDLSPHCLELAAEWARLAGVADRIESLVEGDVRDLSRWPDA